MELVQLGNVHRDGSRYVGIPYERQREMTSDGAPLLNKMFQRSVDTSLTADVQPGDVFPIRFDGAKAWWVLRDGLRVGRATWSLSTFEPVYWRDPYPRIDDGTLEVVRLLIDSDDVVINFGGVVRPV